MTKDPWVNHPHIWRTKSEYMSFLRGGVRRGLWEKNQIKINFKKENRCRVPLGKKTRSNPKGEIWGAKCFYCGGFFKESAVEVDHFKGGHSLKDVSDLVPFIKGLLFVDNDDLRLACKKCHKQKTLSESRGISFEEAGIQKQVIAFGDKTAGEQKSILHSLGLKEGKNKEIRKNIYNEYLGGEKQ